MIADTAPTAQRTSEQTVSGRWANAAKPMLPLSGKAPCGAGVAYFVTAAR